KDDEFDAALAKLSEATGAATIDVAMRTAHERLVDNPPWLFIVHDLNPRAMSKNVQGFVSAQSWFADLTLVSMRKRRDCCCCRACHGRCGVALAATCLACQ